MVLTRESTPLPVAAGRAPAEIQALLKVIGQNLPAKACRSLSLVVSFTVGVYTCVASRCGSAPFVHHLGLHPHDRAAGEFAHVWDVVVRSGYVPARTLLGTCCRDSIGDQTRQFAWFSQVASRISCMSDSWSLAGTNKTKPTVRLLACHR